MRRLPLLLAVFALLSSATAASAAPPPLSAYGALPAVESVTISPGGDKIAMVAPGPDGRRVLLVRTLGGQTLFAGGLKVAKLRGVMWAGDDHVLLEASNTMGEMQVYLFETFAVVSVNLKTKKISGVFDNSDEVINALFGYFGSHQEGGRTFIYVSGVERTALHSISNDGLDIYGNLYRYDLDAGSAEMLFRSGNRSREFVVEQGAIVAHATYDPDQQRLRLFRGAGEEQEVASWPSKRSLDESGLVGSGRTEGTVLVRDDQTSVDQIREIPLAGGGKGEVVPELENADLIKDRVTGLTIGAGILADPGAKMFDTARQGRLERARKAFPAEANVTLASFDDAFEKLVFYVDGPDDSGGYWLVDASTGGVTQLASTYPDVGAGQVGPVRVFSYKAADGLGMEGILTLPLGRPAKDLPLVLLPHGGPIVGPDLARFNWWAQAFASRGYAVFQPNYRGTLGFGAAFRHAAEGQFGRKMQTDLSDGVAALAKAGIVDPKRVCIVGGSYGGYAALAGVTLQKGVYRCAVADAPVADLRSMLIEGANLGPDRRAMLFWTSLAGDMDQMDAVSPAKRAAAADAPILLVHGKDDTVVPISQSFQMKRALEAAGKPVEMVVMEGEDHWLSRPATRTAMLTAAVAFVEKHNPPN